MAAPSPTRNKETTSRKKVIILLAIGTLLLFGILLSQSSFDLPFLNPETSQQRFPLLFFAALTILIFLLFVALTFVLARNLLKLFAERRLGVLGSKFRTRLVVGGLLLSFLPVIMMFWFAYGLMNRSLDKWFSRPVEEVREDTAAAASLVSKYAAQNARAEAESIAAAPETQRAFAGHSFSSVMNEFRRHETTLQNGFALALEQGNAEASLNAPASWPLIKAKIPVERLTSDAVVPFKWENTDYILSAAPVADRGFDCGRDAAAAEVFGDGEAAGCKSASLPRSLPANADWCDAPTWNCCSCSRCWCYFRPHGWRYISPSS